MKCSFVIIPHPVASFFERFPFSPSHFPASQGEFSSLPPLPPLYKEGWFSKHAVFPLHSVTTLNLLVPP